MIFEIQPFIWDEEAFLSHVESVLVLLGEYHGNNYSIRKTSDGWQLTGSSGEFTFINIQEAILILTECDGKPLVGEPPTHEQDEWI